MAKVIILVAALSITLSACGGSYERQINSAPTVEPALVGTLNAQVHNDAEHDDHGTQEKHDGQPELRSVFLVHSGAPPNQYRH